ncbi:TBC1 domain family member 13 [Pancytospora philotis]|nr:TBC1 domain family member 13 [Pancytospora philotis]
MADTQTEIPVDEDCPDTPTYQKMKLAVLVAKQLDPTDTTPMNIYELRNYIYYGFSSDELRPRYWKVLLNYYSTNQFKHEQYYRASRESYHEMQSRVDLGSAEAADILKMINSDLPRTPALQEQISAGQDYTDAITRILTLFSITNKDIGYVQGSINLLLPLYHVLVQNKNLEDSRFAEEDAFFLFNNLMSEIGPHLSAQHDKLADGVNARVEAVLGLLKERDPALHSELVKKDLINAGFMLRWVMLLFSAEFSLDTVVWLWDRLLSDAYRFEMLDYCCVSALVLLRDVLLTESFEKCMAVLQNLSIIDAEVLFHIADVMRRDGDRDIVKHISERQSADHTAK